MSGALEFGGEEESEDDQSVRLTDIDMNVLMDEYKMISEDTQLVVNSLKYYEPMAQVSHSLNESEIQQDASVLPEIDMYAAIMQDQEDAAQVKEQKVVNTKLENAAKVLRSVTDRQQRIQQMDVSAAQDQNEKTFEEVLTSFNDMKKLQKRKPMKQIN